MDAQNYWFSSGAAGGGGDAGDPIGQSLRFREGSAAALSRTMGSGNRKTYTISIWIKRGKMPSADQNHMWIWHQNPNITALVWQNNKLRFYNYNSSGTFNAQYLSTAVFRDPSAWYHVVAAIDTTIASPAGDRVKLWVNGERLTTFDTQTTFSQDYETFVGANGYTCLIGKYASGDTWQLGAYLADHYFIDGQALEPTAFGRENTDGVWVPREVDFTPATMRYSDMVTSSTGGYQTAEGPEKMFDGSLTTYTQSSTSPATITFTPQEPIPFNTLRVNSYRDADQEHSLNGGAFVSHGTDGTKEWWTVSSTPGTLESLAFKGTWGGQVAAIEVTDDDGTRILTDPFLWSSYLSFVDSIYDGNVAANAFDGSTSTQAGAFNNATGGGVGTSQLVWAPPDIDFTDKVEVWTFSANGTEVSVNGGAFTQIQQGDWREVATGGGTITNITCRNPSGNSVAWLSGIRVDGQVYVDGANPSYGANGFHLQFANPDDIGKDYSGNGNDFTATGFNTTLPANYTFTNASGDVFSQGGTAGDVNAPFANPDKYVYASPAGVNTLTYTFHTPISVTGSLDIITRGGQSATAFGTTTATITYADGSTTATPFLNSGASESSSVDLSVTGFGNAISSIVLANTQDRCGGFAGIKINGTKLLLAPAPESADYDLMQDSPTQNYATLNPLLGVDGTNSPSTFEDANLSDGNVYLSGGKPATIALSQ